MVQGRHQTTPRTASSPTSSNHPGYRTTHPAYLRPQRPPHSSVSPSAQRTNEQPARIVSAAPTASSDGLTSTYFTTRRSHQPRTSSHARVLTYQVHSDQTARLMHTLGDIIALAQRQAAADGGACAGRPLRIQAVDVEGQVDGRVGADVPERHFHHAADAVSARVSN